MLPEKQSKCAQKSITLSKPPPLKKKISSLKKLKPPPSGRNRNICEVKKCDNNYRGSSKKIFRGGRPKIPPTTYGENGLSVERKDCPHRKIPP